MNNLPDYLNDALEMMDMDLDEPKQIISEVSGFIPMFTAVIEHYHDHTRAAVHGAMWRFCRMNDGVCKASLRTIGAKIGLDAATVQRHADALVTDGYFVDLTPDARNKPHVYADTGKIVMKNQITATVAQRNTPVAQRNATVAESQLNKDINKDSNKNGNRKRLPPASFGAAWVMAAGGSSEDVAASLEDGVQKQARMVDAANEVAKGGFGIAAPEAYAIALAFMQAMDLVIPKSQYKGQRVAIREMLDWGVTAEHVKQAIWQLKKNPNLSLADLHSVKKQALSVKNKEADQQQPQGSGWLVA